MRSPQPVTVWLDHITIDIDDQVARKTYDCTFRNPNANAIVGATCYMELEPGAQVDDMSVWVDGKEMKAEILDVEKAKEVFTDIVKNGGSPALLEYYGNQLIQTQVPKIAPNSTVKVKLKYTTVLKKKGDLYRIQCLNTNPKASIQPLKSASVTVNIRSQEPIKNIYSPTHKVKLVEVPDADISVQWQADEYLPKNPFVLYYQVDPNPVGASLVAHRELGDEGSFMLMLSPTMGQGAGQLSASDILPKDVIFCVDTSGSMLDGGKMEQAREALKYCVSSLRPQDRFNIVDFSTSVRAFAREGLVEANEQNRQRAMNYIKKLAPRGGTAISDALEESLGKFGEGDRLKMVLFATDGLPTIGEREHEKILRKVAKQNTDDVRMFVFGEGFDVNTKLLDFLAINNRGEADYILPDEEISKKISAFFDRVGSPVMTDLEVSFGDLEVRDVYPTQVTDLFKGEQVIVYGRYTGSGTHTIKLTGNFRGERTTLEYTMDFPEVTADDKNSFVPRLWAGKKIDFLLSELRKADTQDEELVDEVTYLAKRYGIVTPYTSYLMAEDVVTDAAAPLKQRQLIAGRLQREASAAEAPGAVPAADRRKAVEEAKELANLRQDAAQSGGAGAFDKLADGYLAKSEQKQSALQQLRYIGTRTFYHSKDRWYDSEYSPTKVKDVQRIKVGSPKYFELLAKNDDLAKYLALTNLIIQFEGQWYEFEGGM